MGLPYNPRRLAIGRRAFFHSALATAIVGTYLLDEFEVVILKIFGVNCMTFLVDKGIILLYFCNIFW